MSKPNTPRLSSRLMYEEEVAKLSFKQRKSAIEPSQVVGENPPNSKRAMRKELLPQRRTKLTKSIRRLP